MKAVYGCIFLHALTSFQGYGEELGNEARLLDSNLHSGTALQRYVCMSVHLQPYTCTVNFN